LEVDNVQFFDGLNDLRPNGVEMDIPDEGEKIILFIAEYGFVAILEQMTRAVVTTVEILSIPGEEFTHDG